MSGVIPLILGQDRPIFYTACKVCRRKMVELADYKYSCEYCHLFSSDGVPSYMFSCIFMDLSDSIILNVIGNEMGEAILGQPASTAFKPRPIFKQTSLLVRAKAEIYNERLSIRYTPVRSFCNLGLDYPFRDDNYMLLEMLN